MRRESDGAGGATRRQFWHNLQVLRVVSAYAIVFIHMASAFRAVDAGPAVVEVLRFGTDMFLVIAGFLTAHILGASGKSGGEYMRNRLIRLVPLYWIFTLLAFVVQNYLMRSHPIPASDLFMSLSFVPYGKYPVLYPAWTLVVIAEFSLIVAFFQTISGRHGVAGALAFVVVLTVGGRLAGFQEPSLAFLTNPILIDFALGIVVYRIVTSPAFGNVPRRLVVTAACALLAAGAMFVVVRPLLWPEAPRLLALGLPVAVFVLGAVALERAGVYRESPAVNFIAKCTYSIYLTHWFVDVLSDRIVVESGHLFGVGLVMLLTTPILVSYVSILTYLYVEAPLTRTLSRRLTAQRAQFV
jgi:peptidoglycan/LPS O-acetylase OafA/YrhL